MDILDEWSSFENLIIDYLYDRYGLNENNNFTSESLNLEKLINIVNNFKNKYTDKLNEYYFEQASLLIKDLFADLYGSGGFYENEIKENIDIPLNILYNMKNILFQKYYKNKYAQMKDLYIDLIQKLTIITPSLNKTVTNFFDEIINEHTKYSTTNWTKNIDEKISLHFSNTFPNNLINNYLTFIKNNITKSYNISYLEENSDTIINRVESRILSSDIISNLVQEILKGNYKNYGFDISIQNLDGNINNEEIKETLENLNIKQYSQTECDIKNDANTIKNTFLSKLNYTFEDLDLGNKIKSYINNTIYSTYTFNDTLDNMINRLFPNKYITDYLENIPNFFKMAYNMSYNYYKTVYSEIAKYYKSIIN